MSEASGPPFRADHVGSLLRPSELLRARAEREAGRISAAELRRVEDKAIGDAVAMQREVGLQSVTDGEFRRGSWHMDFLYRIGGVGKSDQTLNIRFRNEGGTVEFNPTAHRVGGKLRLDETIFGEDFAYLKSVAPEGTTPKLTIPSPSMLHYRGGRAAIDAESIPTWTNSGTTRPGLRPGNHGVARARLHLSAARRHQPRLSERPGPARLCRCDRRCGRDPAPDQHQGHQCRLAGRPAGMTVCTHMCRGNFRSSWMAEGGYDHVAEALFGELAVDGFFLEYDDARSGGFEPLRFVPRGPKRVVLGLVTSKRAALESKDELKRRIDEAARYVPLDQLCLSPQCGFSSTVDGNALTIEEQCAKLRLVVETAREVWG